MDSIEFVLEGRTGAFGFLIVLPEVECGDVRGDDLGERVVEWEATGGWEWVVRVA